MSRRPPRNSKATLPDPHGWLEWSATRARSMVEARRYAARIAEVERFCLFVGYPRSGHSLIGSLLDAHEEMAISHELDALLYFEHGLSRPELFGMILRRGRQFEALGRQWTDYDYNVPGLSQGRFSRLRVIGDKKGMRSTIRLNEDPTLLARFRREVAVPLRVVHVTRNPFDNIATMTQRSRLPIPTNIERFTALCEGVAGVRAELDPDERIDLRYEDATADPRAALERLTAFLGVDADAVYLERAAAVVRPSGSRTRDKVTFSAAERAAVEALIARFDFMDGYTFDH